MTQHEKSDDEESLFKWFLQVVGLALVFLAIWWVVFHFLLLNYPVGGDSMQPTFENADRVIAARHATIHRQDIVTLHAPDVKNEYYIKRVIGLPGDTVYAKNDQVYVNGKKLAEPYLGEYKAKLAPGQKFTQDFSLQQLFGVKRVPQGEYFVLGDHRDISKDSRIIGFIKESAITEKVKVKYWPLNELHFY